VKIYLGGDTSFPALNGTGKDDYIGFAWRQHTFINRFFDCTTTDGSAGHLLKQYDPKIPCN
jgi:D-arabinan exo alpha-(1,3)/(1,5)-arabinofuranosidase (non-reducing end)